MCIHYQVLELGNDISTTTDSPKQRSELMLTAN